MRTLHQITEEKATAYQRARNVAIVTLDLGHPMAFEEILQAWYEYELLVLEEEKFIWKHVPEYYNAAFALSGKNVKDLHFGLPADTKSAWDKDPRLYSWKEQYR